MVKKDLVFEPIGSDVLVFDPDTNEAHSLTGTAARAVLLLREGHSKLSIAQKLGIEFEQVLSVIGELKAIGIVESEDALKVSMPDAGIDRRKLLAQGLVATAAAGAISSIKVPSAAAAGSCIRTVNQTCNGSTSGSRCCVTGCCCPQPVGPNRCFLPGSCVFGCI